MGADLIVSILVGPVKLNPTKAQRTRILRVAVAKKVAAQRLTAAISVHTDLAYTKNPKWNAAIRAEEKLLRKSGMETEEISDIGRLDPDAVLANFLNLWENGARDANYRPVTLKGKKYQILVAGEMSWGDSPEGDGYLVIRDADRLGIIDALGIK